MSGSDTQLITLWAKQRNAEAFAELVNRYAGMVHQSCLRILGNATDAEDVTQQCFLELAQRPPRNSLSLGGWLHRMATHRALNQLRANKRRQQREKNYAKNSLQVHEATWDEIQQYVDEAIAALKPAYRDVIVLHFLQEKSQQECARLLHIAPRTIRYRQTKAIEGIRRHLKRKGIIVSASLAMLLSTNLAQAAPLPETLLPSLRRLALSGLNTPTSAATALTTLLFSLKGATLAGGVGCIVFFFVAQSMLQNNPASPLTPPPLQEAVRENIVPNVLPATAPEPSVTAIAATETIPPPLTGYVYDADNHPLQGVTLWRNRHDAFTKSNQAGFFALEKLSDDRTYDLALHAKGFYNIRVPENILGFQLPVHVEVLLPREKTKPYYLKDPLGNPVQGAQVFRENTTQLVTITAADGSFEAPLDLYRCTISHPEWGKSHERLDMDRRMIAFKESTPVTVRALNQGKAAPGVLVQYTLDGNIQSTTTNPQGEAFLWLNLHKETVIELRADQKDGTPLFGKHFLKVTSMEAQSIDINLKDLFVSTLHGRLLSKNGQPVTNTQIGVRPSGVMFQQHTTKTDAKGNFTLALFNGNNNLWVAQSGYEWVNEADKSLVASSDTPTIRKTFRTRGAGNSKEDAFTSLLQIRIAYETEMRPERLLLIAGGYRNYHRFWLPMPKADVLEFDTKNWRSLDKLFIVDAEHKLGALVDFSKDSQQKGLTITLDTPIGAVQGTIKDHLDEVLAYQEIQLRTQDGSFYFFTQSDANGHYEFWPVPLNNALKLSVYAWDGIRSFEKDFTPRQVVQQIKLTLKRPITLAGEVFYDDGALVDRGSVMLLSVDTQEPIGRIGIYAGRFEGWSQESRVALFATDDSYESATLNVKGTSETLSLIIPRPTSAPIKSQSENEALSEAQRRWLELGLVIKMYANEAKGGFFPDLSPTQGGFYPDMQQVFPEYLSNSDTVAHLRGEALVKPCYLGYFLENEAQGLAFLDAYEELGAQEIQGKDIEVGNGNGSFGGDTFMRLQEGGERLLNTNINDPEALNLGQKDIPVMWEMPGPERPDECWVLYMDGHTEWKPYPGVFPLTEAFTQRIIELRANPQ